MTDQCKKIVDTLERLGFPLSITDEDRYCDPIAVINDELIKIAVERENKIFDNRFKLSKMPDATFLRDYYDVSTGKLEPLNNGK